MIRKFNYTGRKKLNRQRVDISIIDEPPHKTFTAILDLEGLGLSGDAKVYIEPYHKSSFMRFSFGTVSNLQPPEKTILTDIPSTTIIKFRVKVVDETTKNGRIIRIADKIKPKNLEESGNRLSILHIDWDKDLDQQIFRVTFPDNDYPRLEINKRIENAKELVKSDAIFRALVFPVAVRQVAERIVITRNLFEEEDSSWQSIWLKFIKNILHVNVEVDFEEESDNEDEMNYWVEEIVAAFCRKNKFRTKFEQALNNKSK
jgi:hypothetical protein